MNNQSDKNKSLSVFSCQIKFLAIDMQLILDTDISIVRSMFKQTIIGDSSAMRSIMEH